MTAVLLPSVPPSSNNLVKFTHSCWSLPCESEVGVNVTVYAVYLISLPYAHSCRVVHSFTCAGILQTQYIQLSKFAGLGTVENTYIRHGTKKFTVVINVTEHSSAVYNRQGYVDLVHDAAEM